MVLSPPTPRQGLWGREGEATWLWSHGGERPSWLWPRPPGSLGPLRLSWLCSSAVLPLVMGTCREEHTPPHPPTVWRWRWLSSLGLWVCPSHMLLLKGQVCADQSVVICLHLIDL